MKNRYYGATARAIAIERRRQDGNAYRSLLLKLALLLAGILVFTLAGTYSAGAEQVFPENLALPNGIQPEGIATGRGTDFFVGSLADGRIYKGDLRTGEGEVLVPGVSGRRIAGLKVDQRTNYVFAAGTGSGKAFVFDGGTGALLAEYQLTTATPTFINDVVLTPRAAYFTDSNQPVFYKLSLGPGGSLPAQADVETIALSGAWQQVAGFNANGIEATPNGKALIFMHSSLASLFLVDPATGAARLIDLGGASLTNGDGILLEGKTLYVMQNRLNQISAVRLDATLKTGSVTKVITDPAFRVPTTIARFGKWIYAVNARFGTPGTPDTDYDVVQVLK